MGDIFLEMNASSFKVELHLCYQSLTGRDCGERIWDSRLSGLGITSRFMVIIMDDILLMY